MGIYLLHNISIYGMYIYIYIAFRDFVVCITQIFVPTVIEPQQKASLADIILTDVLRCSWKMVHVQMLRVVKGCLGGRFLRKEKNFSTTRYMNTVVIEV